MTRVAHDVETPDTAAAPEVRASLDSGAQLERRTLFFLVLLVSLSILTLANYLRLNRVKSNARRAARDYALAQELADWQGRYARWREKHPPRFADPAFRLSPHVRESAVGTDLHAAIQQVDRPAQADSGESRLGRFSAGVQLDREVGLAELLKWLQKLAERDPHVRVEYLHLAAPGRMNREPSSGSGRAEQTWAVQELRVQYFVWRE